MITKIWREWIRLSVCKDQRADGVEEPACDEQGDGSHAESTIDRADQKNNNPAHQQKTDIRYQYRDPGKENGLKCNKEDRQTPDNAK